MKRIFLITITLLCGKILLAQPSPTGEIVSPDRDIREKIVSLAMQNPELEIADFQVKIAQYQLKEAKGWWLNNISFSLNANEFTVKRLSGQKQSDDLRQYPYYPLYNMGVSIPLGGLFSKPAATKAARERVAIAQATRAGKYRQVRATALSVYEDYLTQKELYTLQSQVTENSYNEYLQASQKFRRGEISLEEYNMTETKYNDALKGRITAKSSYNISKIQLEELIGVPIDQVLQDMNPRGDRQSSDSGNQ